MAFVLDGARTMRCYVPKHMYWRDTAWWWMLIWRSSLIASTTTCCWIG